MKRFLLLTIGGLLLTLQPGCGDGVAYTREERAHHYREQAELDSRMLADDLDLFMLTDRPSRLSRFRVP